MVSSNTPTHCHYYLSLKTFKKKFISMLLQKMFEGHLSTRYEVLTSVDPEVERPRRCWSKKMNRRLKGFRVSRLRKLNWKAYSVVIWSRKLARIYAEVVNRILKIQDVCPGIIFSCQWGLPVLSHPNANCRRRALKLERNYSFNDIILTK